MAFGAIGGGLSALVPFLNSNPDLFGASTVLIAAVLGVIEKAIPNNF